MKTLTQFNEAAQPKVLKVSKDAIGYLTVPQLKEYLEATKGFLKQETKDLIQWLIINNETFMSKLESDEENVLAGFYKKGKPKTDEEKQVYEWMKAIIEDDRFLEIPLFLTKKQYDQIINKEVVPDRIFWRMDDEEGKNICAKKFEPLMHKISHQWYGKLNLPYEDLMSLCREAFSFALHSYGKKNKKGKGTEEAVKATKFSQYIAWTMLNNVRDLGAQESHVVKVAKADMTKERTAKGFNAKSHAVSGDKVVGHSTDDGNKTLFDFIDSGEDAATDMDRADIKKLWAEVYKILEKNFDKKHIDVWCSYNELNGHKKLSNKELAEKYKVANSNITYYVSKVNVFITKNKQIMDLLREINDLTNECLQDEWRRNRDVEPVYLNYQNDSLLV